MIGQGRPYHWFAALFQARRISATAAMVALLLGMPRAAGAQEASSARPTTTTNGQADASPTMRLRITFGGGSARIWTGWISISDGQFRNPQLLGLEPDEPGSMGMGVRVIQIRQPSPRSYDGLDIDVHGSLETRLQVRLAPADAPSEQRVFEFSLGELVSGVQPSGGPQDSQLDARGNRLVISRAPGDRLRVDYDADTLIFQPGELFRYSIVPHLCGLAPREDVNLKVRIVSRLTGVEHFSREQATTTADDGSLEAWGPFEFPVPEGDDVYDLVVVVEKSRFLDPLAHANPLANSSPLIKRRLQFVALAAESPAPEVEARERLVDEIDPVSSNWGERAARWPILKRIPRMKQGKLTHGKSAIARHLEKQWMQMSADAWQAHPVSIDSPGEPHILEIEYPNDIAQTLGISLLEANALGKIAPLGVDTAVRVEPLPVGGAAGTAKHRLIFWPRTTTPIVLLTSHEQERSAIYGKLRVYHVGKQLPMFPLPTDAQNHRTAAAWFEKPIFPEMYGAHDAADAEMGRSLDDWRTFYEASQRLTSHLQYAGYNAAVIPALCEGSTLYPSALLEPTPKYDTGVYLSQGHDPQRKDVLELLLRLFDRQDLKLYPSLQFNTPLPQLEILRSGDPRTRIGIELVDHQGRTWISRNAPQGGLAPYYNPLDARVQAAMAAVVSELVERYGHHPSFGGVVLNVSPDGYAMLPDANWGFDDRTFARFVADTGTSDPGAGRDRFAERARWCRTQGRDQWLAWRASKMTGLYRTLATEVRKGNDQAQLILSGSEMLRGDTLRRYLRPSLVTKPATAQQIQSALLELGFEVQQLTREEGISVVAPHPELAQPMGGAAAAIDREGAETLRALLSADGCLMFRPPATKRVESFDAVSPFGSRNTYTWLAAQVAPSGDASRRRFVESLTRQNCNLMFDGGWMPSRGQEDAMRSALLAFRQLPQNTDEPSSKPRARPPVILRSAVIESETIVCAINNSPWPVTADVRVKSAGSWNVRLPTDLADKSTSDESRWTVFLEPYDAVTATFDRTDIDLAISNVQLPTGLRQGIDEKLRDMQRRAAALRSPPPVAALNLDFETPLDETGNIPGWLHARAEGGSVELVDGGHDGSAKALRLVSRGPEVWVRSQPIKTPTTGRITVWARLRVPEGSPQPDLRLAVEARRRGRPYYRFANVGAGVAQAAIGSEWAPFILQIDDLPLEGLDEFRVGFDLMSTGEVWIDDVVIHDLAFSEKEQLQLARLIAEADFRLRDENVAGAVAALEGYWPQFLKRHVDPLQQEVVDTPRRPVRPEREEAPPADPPLRQSILNRARGWWPF